MPSAKDVGDTMAQAMESVLKRAADLAEEDGTDTIEEHHVQRAVAELRACK